MGWTYNAHPCSKESFVKQILMESGAILAHSVRGNRLWTIYQPKGSEADPFILLFLLSRSNGCWGYKDMDETMGPYFFDCPLSFLDIVPEPEKGCHLSLGETGKSWRDHVREYHAKRREDASRRPEVGDKVIISNDTYPGYGGEYTITHNLGRRGFMLNEVLRINCRQVKKVEVRKKGE